MKITPKDQLNQIQHASGYTQAELAAQLNVTQATLNSWINGRSVPRSKALAQIEILYYSFVGQENIDLETLKESSREAMQQVFPLKKLSTDKELLDELVVQFTYNTNSIEGSTMTYDDTRELLIENQALTNRTIIEQLEARNHQAAFLWLIDSLQNNDVDFSPGFLKDIHLRLMNGVRSDAGMYRNHAVRIKGSKTITANHASIPTKLEKLFSQMNRNDISKEDVIPHIAKMHAEFEKIHPFADGNGRVGRLLLLELAIKHEVMPPLVTRAKRIAYYSYLEQAQTKEKYYGLEYFIATSILEMVKVLK